VQTRRSLTEATSTGGTELPSSIEASTNVVAGTQAIKRVFTILSILRDANSELGITDIARLAKLKPSTAHRIVRALVMEGYMAQNEITDQYYLGRNAVILGYAAQRWLGLDAAQSVLERLGEETGESVNLGVRDDMQMLVVLRVESPSPLRFDQPPGSRVPLHATSMGKIALAYSLDLEQDLKCLPNPMPRYTSRTLTSHAKLRRSLDKVRESGYCLDDEESIEGVRCVGAPVLNGEGALYAAIALQAPAVRISDERLESLAPMVKAAGSAVAQLMPKGWRA
jgi:IclR family acetate operon transcriptional repressor